MKEIIFRIENRHLLKSGWQRCVQAALDAQHVMPEQIPQNALLGHYPVPNMQQTMFCLFVLPEGAERPVMPSGKIRDFWPWMQEGMPKIDEREALIQKCIAEQNGGVVH